MSFLKGKRRFAAVLLSGFVWLVIVRPSLATDIDTVFYISSSDNDSKVHYGIHLNSNCSPVRSNPVYYYWLRSDGSTRQLNSQEENGYGISNQAVSGNTVNLGANGFQRYGDGRPLAIKTSRSSNGSCQAHASTTIRGVSTQLAHSRVLVQRRKILGQTVQARVLGIVLTGSNGSSETMPCSRNCTVGLPLP